MMGEPQAGGLGSFEDSLLWAREGKKCCLENVLTTLMLLCCKSGTRRATKCLMRHQTEWNSLAKSCDEMRTHEDTVSVVLVGSRDRVKKPQTSLSARKGKYGVMIRINGGGVGENLVEEVALNCVVDGKEGGGNVRDNTLSK